VTLVISVRIIHVMLLRAVYPPLMIVAITTFAQMTRAILHLQSVYIRLSIATTIMNAPLILVTQDYAFTRKFCVTTVTLARLIAVTPPQGACSLNACATTLMHVLQILATLKRVVHTLELFVMMATIAT
jgi:hypothetical protein